MRMASSTDETESLSQREHDGELVRRVAAGDKEASRALVDRYLRSIVSFAYRMLGDVAEAEDVAQETFLRLWKNADRWEPRAKLTTWLHHVARNLCVDRLRSRRNLAAGEVPDHADARPGASTQLESRQRDRAVQEALSELAERQRAAIALVYYQGLSNREAADVLGVDVDALESLLARGRRALRKRLAGEDETMSGERETRS
jgi:RNA polymerase sigma-70 factor (ECF subfamily)